MTSVVAKLTTVLALVLGSLTMATVAAPAANAGTAGCVAAIAGHPKPVFSWNTRPYGSIEVIVTQLRPTDDIYLQKKNANGVWKTKASRTGAQRPAEIVRASATKGSKWRAVVKRGVTSSGACATYTSVTITKSFS